MGVLHELMQGETEQCVSVQVRMELYIFLMNFFVFGWRKTERAIDQYFNNGLYLDPSIKKLQKIGDSYVGFSSKLKTKLYEEHYELELTYRDIALFLNDIDDYIGTLSENDEGDLLLEKCSRAFQRMINEEMTGGEKKVRFISSSYEALYNP